MTFSTIKKNLLRLYIQYVRKHLYKLIVALILSFAVAGGTAAIAWLLDPVVKKIFIDQDKTMLLLIPAAIVIAFCVKGLSLYFARTILIRVANEVVKSLQVKLSSCILNSDVNTIESKHSGKYIAHVFYDTGLVSQLVSAGLLNLMKDSLTLIVLIGLMFYQNWKLALFALIMMPLAAFVAKSLGKRMNKAVSQSTKIEGNIVSYFTEIIKGSKLMLILKSNLALLHYLNIDIKTQKNGKIM